MDEMDELLDALSCQGGKAFKRVGEINYKAKVVNQIKSKVFDQFIKKPREEKKMKLSMKVRLSDAALHATSIFQQDRELDVFAKLAKKI
jgi:hypothetical protein